MGVGLRLAIKQAACDDEEEENIQSNWLIVGHDKIFLLSILFLCIMESIN
jgi:hypothetical protein